MTRTQTEARVPRHSVAHAVARQTSITRTLTAVKDRVRRAGTDLRETVATQGQHSDVAQLTVAVNLLRESIDLLRAHFDAQTTGVQVGEFTHRYLPSEEVLRRRKLADDRKRFGKIVAERDLDECQVCATVVDWNNRRGTRNAGQLHQVNPECFGSADCYQVMCATCARQQEVGA